MIRARTPMILSTLLLLFAGLLLAPLSTDAQDGDMVRVLKQEGRSENQDDYYLELLELALELTKDEYGPYTLKFTDEVYTQRQGLKEMRSGGPIDIVYTMTSEAREYVFKPIRIPILKGMMGYRIPIVQEGNADLFQGATGIEDLKGAVFCQGSDWPDTEILKQNGLKVNTSDSYGNLFQMVESGSCDAFPRGITEVWDELEKFTEMSITAEQNVLIKYPTAFYYFVRKTDKRLADRIEKGLNKAIADGTFNQLFMKYNKEFIQKAKFNKRTIIELTNPLLNENTPLGRKELWLNVGTR